MNVQVPFSKLVGTGNDFVVVDGRRRAIGHALAGSWKDLAVAMCDRRYGVGADGLLVLEPAPSVMARMRVFNPDGSEAEMCGNGARCVARYLSLAAENGRKGGESNGQRVVTLVTKAGALRAQVHGDTVAMRMTDPTDLRLDVSMQVKGRRLQASSINTGVPHIVVPVSSLDRIDVAKLGRELRSHRMFAPAGTNVDFTEVDAEDRQRVRIRTYERGVEGETLACGTGVVAAAVIHVLHAGRTTRMDSTAAGAGTRVLVQVRSGEWLTVSLQVTRQGRAVRVSGMVLEGPARLICHGVFTWNKKGGR